MRSIARKVLLLTPLVAGIFLRIYHLFVINLNEPFNLGGLFYQISIQIINEGFVLPKTIPHFSIGGLPFAYPPLPFYIQAIIIKLFSLGIFTAVNLLPPTFSILSLILFAKLTKKYLRSDLGFFTAVFTFAVTPQAFNEQIEAQGLAESLGTLVLIAYTFSLFKLKVSNNLYSSLISGVLLGISVLSSPGTAYASALISTIYALEDIVLNRPNYRKTILKYAIVAFIGILVSLPYWGTAISNHGVEIFTAPFLSQNSTSLSLTNFELLSKPTTFYQIFWKTFLVLGVLTALIQVKLSLLSMLLITDFIPREAWLVCIPISLLIGNVFDSLSNLTRNLKVAKLKTQILLGIFVVFYSYNILQNGLNSLELLISQTDYDLPQTHIEDLHNLKNKVPNSSGLVVIGSWGLIEWSSLLLEHEVLNNQFGLEWQPRNETFAKQLTVETLRKEKLIDIVKTINNEYPERYQDVYLILDKNFTPQPNFLYSINNKFQIIERYENLILLKVDNISAK